MLFGLHNVLSSLTTSPATTAIDQAHRMAQRRLADGGAAPGLSGSEKKVEPVDLVLPDDVDAAAVAKAVRQQLGIPDSDDPLHPLERRKLGGRVVLGGRHLLRLGDGHFEKGRAFVHRIVREIRSRLARR